MKRTHDRYPANGDPPAFPRADGRRTALSFRLRLGQGREVKKLAAHLYLPSLALAVLMRFAIIVVPGNSITTPWSGGGDMLAYETLARNLVSGNDYTYAHVPSAWRTPGYPLVIAAAMALFGGHFAVAVRTFQVLLSMLAAYLCMRAARVFFGHAAAKVTLVAALWFPTLLYFSGEFLSESLSAFFVALFFWLFAEDSINPRWTTAAAMGFAIGLGALVRPNLAAIGAIALAGAWLFRHSTRMQFQIVLIPLCAALVFAPWILRNYRVFGRFVVSTKSGTDALSGVLNPESRFLPGWEDRMRSLVGHLLPPDLETNSPSRLALGSELDLDRACWQATRFVWTQMSWSARARLVLHKWLAYWLSTDQLLEPGHISLRNRILHSGAVGFYWLLLALACLGWRRLRQTSPRIAFLFLAYALLMTILHSPFVMNTRIRSPLLDPLIAILAAGSVFAFTVREKSADLAHSSWAPNSHPERSKASLLLMEW